MIDKVDRLGPTHSNSIKLLPLGTPIGLCDSNGKEFKSGSIVRCETDSDIFGKWVDYEIVLQGTTPLMVYNKSEKENSFKIGHTAGCLSDFYDNKLFVFSEDPMNLRPLEKLVIVD